MSADFRNTKSRVRHAQVELDMRNTRRVRNVAHCNARAEVFRRFILRALWQPKVQISWQAEFCARARSSTDFLAGAARSQGQAQISWQARHFRKVR